MIICSTVAGRILGSTDHPVAIRRPELGLDWAYGVRRKRGLTVDVKEMKVIRSEVILDRWPWLRILEEDIQLSDGTLLDNYIITQEPDVGAVFALTEQRQVVLVREFKIGASRYVWDLPAGGLETDRSPLAGTKRELLEETGYESDSWYPLGSFVVMPSRSRSCLHSFLSINAVRTNQPKADPKEQVTTHLVELDALLPMIQSGELDSLESVVTILLALEKLKELKL